MYVGFSADLRERFGEHNKGKVRSTKPYLPWKLVYYEAYINQTDARKRERELKEHKPKSDSRKQIVNSLKIEE